MGEFNRHIKLEIGSYDSVVIVLRVGILFANKVKSYDEMQWFGEYTLHA